MKGEMNMADIQISAHIQGESSTQAAAGMRISVSAHCIGRASAANSRAPQAPVPAEPQAPKGK